ncbi:MAG: hypothetical protein D4R67_08125 [Bacteroidetes bacterium]|nr:MAG: hypothetical protein D4R67_08125 [Bacteroidota bacterium]
MKKKLFLMLVGLGTILMLTTSCAKLPQEDMDAANASIEAAKAAEADRYVPAEFNALQDTMTKATTEIEAQKSKFSLFRSYKAAKVLLAKVDTMAKTVTENAIARKEEVKNEVQTALTEITPMIDEVKALIKKAPRGKEGKAALEAIQTDLAGVEATLTEVTTLINNGDYLTAQEKLNAAKAKLESLKQELQEAIAKKRGRK